MRRSSRTWLPDPNQNGRPASTRLQRAGDIISHIVNELIKYGLYFLLGGTIVSLSTYLGSQGRSFLAAFASTFPAITGATFLLIYLNGGTDSLVGYAKNLLWFVPPWIVYVISMIVVVPRLGFWPGAAMSLTLYMMCIAILKMTLR
ncbi:conserved membrane protein of unknown function [Nitrospira japonica]|uniref:DUF3147 domain-containing protein n=1 Tax=Nitrospira japonica TaxID=1325564 RepID=A0A1W1HZR5_9BACT|nr:DUF3147 domain-containing protein [Nitrospira japonica]SLM46248.1 conserved membrane protein of unknown function [Nitrospira japonica]